MEKKKIEKRCGGGKGQGQDAACTLRVCVLGVYRTGGEAHGVGPKLHGVGGKKEGKKKKKKKKKRVRRGRAAAPKQDKTPCPWPC